MEDPKIPIPLQEYKQFLNPILIFVFYMILQKEEDSLCLIKTKLI